MTLWQTQANSIWSTVFDLIGTSVGLIKAVVTGLPESTQSLLMNFTGQNRLETSSTHVRCRQPTKCAITSRVDRILRTIVVLSANLCHGYVLWVTTHASKHVNQLEVFNSKPKEHEFCSCPTHPPRTSSTKW